MVRGFRILRQSRQGPAGRTGFTLIELLVTIAILGLLTAVAVPAVRSARSRFTKMQCQNNLREIAVVMQLYLDMPRNALTLPVAASLPSVDAKDKKRPALYVPLKRVNPHVQTLFRCPDDFDYFDTEGLSYEYYAPWLSGKSLKSVLKTSTGETQPASEVWVLHDFDQVHEGSWVKKGRNVLWLDWHITDYMGVDPEGYSSSSDSSSDTSSSSTGSSNSNSNSTSSSGGGSGSSSP